MNKIIGYGIFAALVVFIFIVMSKAIGVRGALCVFLWTAAALALVFFAIFLIA